MLEAVGAGVRLFDVAGGVVELGVDEKVRTGLLSLSLAVFGSSAKVMSTMSRARKPTMPTMSHGR